MTRLGLPVPPGFIVTTEACRAYLATGELAQGLWERRSPRCGSWSSGPASASATRSDPLLVSCRSGAKFSMPGMMDTVLNIGLNDEVAEGLVALTGDARFVYDAYRRLMQMFGTVVLGVPDEPFERVLPSYARTAAGRERRRTARRGSRTRSPALQGTSSREQAGREFPAGPAASSCGWRPRPCSARGTASAPATTAMPPAFPTTSGTAVNIVAMVFGNMGAGLGHRRGHHPQRLHRRATSWRATT